ncbi:NTP pyrophosphohydrolase [Candidatus Filomicrobium marinum]|uniref:NTP pyrophosphohydrolase n=1 Tax=Candidatus Filomicrobium marinum TaxID=1608628 RepID=A0A0D6JBH7_9HYPH|nr:NUDIX hydrolase [Candidatus Filomicrobium marinum]CFX05134.1 NTP pyrophosphohydrolase [Candidatus Filomicrobium marinum]CPR16183.1 NTP pyrophosphohydrolase [Candidatus Filomicrobium marinum]
MTPQKRIYTKDDLLADMAAVEPFDEKERADIRATIEFLRRDSNPFDRTNFAGHITGSGFLLSPDRQSVLLTHHAALDKWLQFGGHADGEADIRNVALRETEEESGKTDIKLFTPGIFDVDVHEIPENPNKGEPRHLHYDIRYLLLARSLDFKVSHESKALQWVPLRELSAISFSGSLNRMAIKTTP